MTTVVTSSAILKATFQGLAANGSIAVPGVKAGDLIVDVVMDNGAQGTSVYGNFGGPLVVTDDQIEQTGGFDYSNFTFTAFFIRA